MVLIAQCSSSNATSGVSIATIPSRRPGCAQRPHRLTAARTAFLTLPSRSPTLSAGGQVGNNDSADDIAALDLTKIHYLSGPIAVEGAEPGDALMVEILDVAPLDEEPWGYSTPPSCFSGFGLRPVCLADPSSVRVRQRACSSSRTAGACLRGTSSRARPRRQSIVLPSANMQYRELTFSLPTKRY